MTNKTDWTSPFIIAGLATADALEIAGCVDLGDCVERVAEMGERSGERVDDQPGATFWSVYIWREGQGADCIADRSTAEEARAFAAKIAAERKLPIHDWA
ncbi:MAG: hypothetical protein V4696_03890 [Pseudomonadota bacterium]